MSKPIQLIVACSENRVIGRAGRLPFDIPEDKRWFHEQTANQTVVLGRICYETWPQVLSDGRQPVVITSQPDHILKIANSKVEPGLPPSLKLWRAEEPERGLRSRGEGGRTGSNRSSTPLTAANVPAALALARTLPGAIMVCGGQRIYEETLPLADRLLLTLVHAEIEGDTWFPEWRHLAWRETSWREGADANYRYTFSILERVW